MTEEELVQFWLRMPRSMREALTKKARDMGCDSGVLVRTVLDTWLTNYAAVEVALGAIINTINIPKGSSGGQSP